MKLVIDTDMSFDDLLALLYLLQHPDVEVQAITVVNGVTWVPRGLKNLQRLLGLCGQAEIPVAGGPLEPLEGTHSFPATWRPLMDFGLGLFLPRRQAGRLARESAPELLVRTLQASPEPLTILALGPLTNLALALQADPGLVGCIERLVYCGGAIHVPGTIHAEYPRNPNQVAEWNTYIDPLAAQIVLNSGAPIYLVPLDVTHIEGPAPLVFQEAFFTQIPKQIDQPAARLSARLLSLVRRMARQRRYPAVPVWDAAAAILCVDPTIGTNWRSMRLRIVTQPDELAGQMVIDENAPHQVSACLAGESARMEEEFFRFFGSGRA